MKAKKVLNSNQALDYIMVQPNDLKNNEVNDVSSIMGVSAGPSDEVVINGSIDENCMQSLGTTGATQRPLTEDMNGSEERARTLDRNELSALMAKLKLIPDFDSELIPISAVSITSLPPKPTLKLIPVFGDFEDNLSEATEELSELMDTSTDQILNDSRSDNNVNESQTIESQSKCSQNVFNANEISCLDQIFSQFTNGFNAQTNYSPVVEPNCASVPTNDYHMNGSQNSKTNESFDTNVMNGTNVRINTIIDTNINPINKSPNDCENHNNNQMSEQMTQLMNTSVSSYTPLVRIDLNDNSNSPKSLTNSPIKETTRASTTSASTFIPHSQPFSTSSLHTNSFVSNCAPNALQTNLISNQMKGTNKKKKRVGNNVRPMTPIQYCAKDYRIFGMTRSSARHKVSTKDNDFDYDSLANASWGEIDGSQYDCTVSKWADEDMNEDKRKEILSSVHEMSFVKSVFESDKGVYYCFTAFRGQSSRENGLKCVLRLDTNAMKHQRFSGAVITRLFQLSGNSVVTTENGKQKKTVETGYEICIPAHTRYTLENRNVDEIYFYVIITKKVSKHV